MEDSHNKEEEGAVVVDNTVEASVTLDHGEIATAVADSPSDGGFTKDETEVIGEVDIEATSEKAAVVATETAKTRRRRPVGLPEEELAAIAAVAEELKAGTKTVITPKKRPLLDQLIKFRFELEQEDGSYLQNPALLKQADLAIDAGNNTSYSVEERLTILMRAAESLSADTNVTDIKHDGLRAFYAVRQGRLFIGIKNAMKEQAKEAKKSKGTGATTESWLDFLKRLGKSVTTIESYMRMARRTDIHPFLYFGVGRCLDVMAITKKDKNAQAFLMHHFTVLFGLETAADLDNFVLGLDTAVLVERIAKAKVTVSHGAVYNVVAAGLKRKIDKSFIDKLVELQKKPGQNPDDLLVLLFKTMGDLPAGTIAKKTKATTPAPVAPTLGAMDASLRSLLEGYKTDPTTRPANLTVEVKEMVDYLTTYMTDLAV